MQQWKLNIFTNHDHMKMRFATNEHCLNQNMLINGKFILVYLFPQAWSLETYEVNLTADAA